MRELQKGNSMSEHEMPRWAPVIIKVKYGELRVQ
jgi:hypothetical protein